MNFKYINRLIIAYFSKFKAIIFLGVFLGIILFTLLNIFIPKITSGKKQTIGITGRFRPNDLPQNILSLISQGLTALEESDIKPSLSESWETPDKGKTWIFKLKDNIYWQDQTVVKSYDINYDFIDVNIDRLDEKTIKFVLENGPYSPFPTVLTRPIFKKGLLGTGDWNVKEISVNNSYVQELILEKGKDIIHYKFYPTLDRTKLAYKLGKIDKITNILDPSSFDTWTNSEIQSETDYSQIVTLFFNTKDEILSDKTTRQALTYAINKKILGIRAESPINRNSWAYNPQLKTYDFDQEKANDFLNKLPDEMKDKTNIKFVSTPSLLPVAEKIVKDWENVGIKSQILVSSIIPTDFQVYLAIFEIPKDPDQYPIWHSTQTETNISKFSNFRIDKLLEDGRIELSLEKRREIYLEFQRFLLEEIPAAFLYHPKIYSVSRKKLFNF